MRRGKEWPETLVFEPGAHVLDLGAQGEPTPLGGVSHTFFASDIRSHSRAASAGLESVLGADLPDGTRFDHAVFEPYQRASKQRVFELIDQVYAALKTGGSLSLAGRKNRGVESYCRRMQDVFGNVSLEGRAGRTRVFESRKSSPDPFSPPVDPFIQFEDNESGQTLTYRTRAGVFSADGFDEGSRLLARTLRSSQPTDILDCGCGAGTIGLSLAALGNGRLTMVDSSALSVWSARENIRLNGLEARAEAHLSDLYAAVPNRKFDLIVSNPPFHEGSAVASPLIWQAPDHLTAGGRLALVCMRVEPYLKALGEVFQKADILAEEGPYTVLSGHSPRG
ncbi:TPA: hypothetical protein DCE37_17950 [Candidatus Latescibacteria bacterium]|nr:hypothetical protein [Candidatus Latescibacterota bacterium]